MAEPVRTMRRLAAAAALPALLAGCSDLGAPVTGDAPPPPPSVSFAADVQPIFDAQCVACHGSLPSGGLDLRAGSARSNLVGVASTGYVLPRVTAGDPDRSVLYLKLAGASGVGDRMPQGGSLDAASIERVRAWIAEGALDN